MEVTAGRVRARDCLYQRHTQHHCRCNYLEYYHSANQTAENHFMTNIKSSKCSQRHNWMAVSKHWCNLQIDTNKHEDLNLVFVNHRKEDEIYPLTTIEIAEAHPKDQDLMVYFKQNEKHQKLKEDLHFQLIEDTKVLCKNDKLIIPASLWHRAVSWYHHYLQHPGHSCLKEILRSMMK